MELITEGLVAVVQKACPTCQLVEPVLRTLADSVKGIIVYTQDDPSFPNDFVTAVDDTELVHSFSLNIEVVPTLVQFKEGAEVGRVVGWNRKEWEQLSGVSHLGAGLPENQPGCGSKTLEPGMNELLKGRYGNPEIVARKVDIPRFSDETEMCFERGWSDGLPVVPPTAERVLRMLTGTRLPSDAIIGDVPPNLVPCTVEKVAINAVLAGCKPDYMPVVLAALEAVLEPNYTLHAIVCSTCFTAPMIVVNGPIAKRIGMNSGLNVLGQGNRANATIGRALNLIVRNIGGARPGGIDRATLGAPSKYTFCFAEDESGDEWEPLSVSRGIARDIDAVTVFQGEGVQGVMDQRSRTPEELTRSLAQCLFAVGHHKLCEWAQAVLVLSPEHYEIFRAAGWTRRYITEALHEALLRPGSEVVHGAGGIAEGVAESFVNSMVPKFVSDGLHLVRAGGSAGLYSAILAGWPGHRAHGESSPITKEIRS